MMKADWMAESATAVGVLGTGFGLWWLDPLAAALVSADILKDGVSNLKTAVLDLANRRPKKTDESGWESLPDEVRDLLRGLPWVADAAVRMREEGHVFMGEAFVVPRPGTGDLVRKLAEAAAAAKALDWRMHELAIMPVERLPGDAPR
jgi:divalent metal cation (Fe/Co/Zn/Cd) transporter